MLAYLHEAIVVVHPSSGCRCSLHIKNRRGAVMHRQTTDAKAAAGCRRTTASAMATSEATTPGRQGGRRAVQARGGAWQKKGAATATLPR
jgi:hypothetical protein